MIHSKYSKALGAFRAYVTPIIFIIGTFGNTFTITTFLELTPKTRFSIYAIALAISNLIILFINTLIDDFFGRGLDYLTNGNFSIKIDNYSNVSCKLMEYFPNVMYFISNYILVVFSVDRLTVLMNPLKYSSILGMKIALYLCIIIYLLGFLVNIPVLHLVRDMLYPFSDEKFFCSMDMEAHRGLYETYVMCKGIVAYTIPFCIIFLNNICIFIKIWLVNRNRKKLQASINSTQPKAPNNQDKNSTALRIGQSQESETGRVASHLALSTSVLLLHLPLVCAISHRIELFKYDVDPHELEVREAEDLSKILSSIDDSIFAVSFFMYYAFLKKFRRCFLNRMRKIFHLNNNSQ